MISFSRVRAHQVFAEGVQQDLEAVSLVKADGVHVFAADGQPDLRNPARTELRFERFDERRAQPLPAGGGGEVDVQMRRGEHGAQRLRDAHAAPHHGVFRTERGDLRQDMFAEILKKPTRVGRAEDIPHRAVVFVRRHEAAVRAAHVGVAERQQQEPPVFLGFQFDRGRLLADPARFVQIPRLARADRKGDPRFLIRHTVTPRYSGSPASTAGAGEAFPRVKRGRSLR